MNHEAVRIAYEQMIDRAGSSHPMRRKSDPESGSLASCMECGRYLPESQMELCGPPDGEEWFCDRCREGWR